MILANSDIAAVRPQEISGSLLIESRFGSGESSFDVLRRSVNQIRVGEAIYPMRTNLFATFYPGINRNNGELVITPSNLTIRGHGKKFDEAQADWNNQFHVLFQTLIAKRPWERTKEEKSEWSKIELLVDVAAYLRKTPYRIRQIGIISQSRPTAQQPKPLPNQIEWESGKKEEIRLDLAHLLLSLLESGLKRLCCGIPLRIG